MTFRIKNKITGNFLGYEKLIEFNSKKKAQDWINEQTSKYPDQAELFVIEEVK